MSPAERRRRASDDAPGGPGRLAVLPDVHRGAAGRAAVRRARSDAAAQATDRRVRLQWLTVRHPASRGASVRTTA
jgi:hypothetical protein